MIDNNNIEVINIKSTTTTTTTTTISNDLNNKYNNNVKSIPIKVLENLENKFKIDSQFIVKLISDQFLENDELLFKIIKEYDENQMDLIKSLLILGNSLICYNEIILSKVLNLIWKIITNPSIYGHTTTDKKYNQFIEQLFGGMFENEVSVNQQFENTFKHTSNSISNYYNLIREFKNNSSNVDVKRIVEIFKILDLFLENSIENFKQYGYEFNYLFNFNIFGTTQLILLSEFIRMSKLKWKLNNEIIEEYQMKFKNHLDEYKQHCIQVYENEIKNMKFTHPFWPSDYSKIYFNKDMQRIRDEWNYFNNLRNNIYSKVFDYLLLWDTYSIDQVCLVGGSDCIGVFKEPFRILLSNCFGTLFKENSFYNNSSFMEIENEIYQRQFNCYTNELTKIKIYHCARIDSIQTSHRNLLKNNSNNANNNLNFDDEITCNKIGGNGGNIKLLSFNNNENNENNHQSSPISFDVSCDLVPYKLIIKQDNTINSFGDNGHGQTWYNNISLFGYKIMNFYGFGENKISGFNSLDCLLTSFVPATNQDSNYIYPNIRTIISSLKSIQTVPSSPIKSVLSSNNNSNYNTRVQEQGYQFNQAETTYYKFIPINIDNNNSISKFNLTLDIEYCDNDKSYLKILNYSDQDDKSCSNDDGANDPSILFTNSNNSNTIELSTNGNTFTMIGNNIKLFNFIFTPICN